MVKLIAIDTNTNSSEQHKLHHGDLHHENILQYGDNWLVIDLKGVIGDKAYEVAAFIRNLILTWTP